MDDPNILSSSDLLNLNKMVKKVTIRSGAVMGKEVSQIVPSKTFSKISRPAGGHEYVNEYLAQDERVLLKGHRHKDADNLASLPEEKDFLNQMEELTSIGSVPNMADVEDDESLKVYANHDFTPRITNLPIESKRETIVRMVETNQVVIILGSTGCGKTTQVPQYILDHHAKLKKRCNIVVTQPRRIAATSVARRVGEERGWDVGTVVGYQIGLTNKTTPETRLTYCTTGVLREKLVRKQSLMDYTHVILDEVHERDIETDFLMLVVRILLRSNSRTVKVILMSATIDPSRFANYFALPLGNQLCPAPVLEVGKFTKFTVEAFYIGELKSLGLPIPKIDFDDPVLSDQAIDLAVELISKFDGIDQKQATSKPSVLVFLPGIHEIEAMHKALVEKSKRGYKWHMIPLHSSINKDSKEEESVVFRPPSEGFRKIILSTNIAESSITVPDVEYVIDFCLTKHLMCDPITNFTSLRYAWAAHSNCIQRAGRAGRVRPGRVYRMVTKSFYETMLPQECEPEMTRCPLTQTVLKAKMLKMGEPKAILARALDPPDLSQIERTILILKEAGALLMTCDKKPSKFDGDITFLGTVMSNLPLDIQFSKLIMLGYIFSILDDAIIMAAWMTVRNVFSNDFYDRLGPYNSKISFTLGTDSDCIAYLNVHKFFDEKVRTNYFKTSRDTEKGFCKRFFLNHKAMFEARELVGELRRRLKNLGVYEIVVEDSKKWSKEHLLLVQKLVIAGAFYPNYFFRGSQGGQVDEHSAVKALSGKDPFRTVYLQGIPPNHCGELYAKSIKDCLEHYAGQVSNISFDGSSKAYVEFERMPSKRIPGKIVYPVYRAIKMRHLRIRVEISLLSYEREQRRIEELGLLSDNLLCLGKEVQTYSRYSELTDIVEFCVSHVENPNSFWVLNVAHMADLNKLQEDLNMPGSTSPCSSKLSTSEIYAAPYPKPPQPNSLFRVKFCERNKDSRNLAKVFFIDYGNFDFEMPISLIQKINPHNERLQHIKDPSVILPFALECTLTSICPSPMKNENGIWCGKAIKCFKNYVMDKILKGEIFSIVDELISVNVFYDETTSVNDKLVEDGFALYEEESLRSKLENAARIKNSNYMTSGFSQSYCQGQSSDRKLSANVLYTPEVAQSCSRKAEYIEPPSEEEGTRTTLRGPSSPLEMKMYGCTRVMEGREVSIDLDSVNSVLLDTNPEDPHERLLVAGYVGANSSGSKLKAGLTTLLPNCHGLAAYICLIFAPSIELRRSADKSRYIGVLCGLGFDEITGESYFPENDMEIVFDEKIGLEDLLLVNKLRYWISKPLAAQQGSDMMEAPLVLVVQSQKKVMECIINYLANRDDIEKNKKKKLGLSEESDENQENWHHEVEIFPSAYCWHQYDKEELLDSGINDETLVYKPHFALKIAGE